MKKSKIKIREDIKDLIDKKLPNLPGLFRGAAVVTETKIPAANMITFLKKAKALYEATIIILPPNKYKENINSIRKNLFFYVAMQDLKFYNLAYAAFRGSEDEQENENYEEKIPLKKLEKYLGDVQKELEGIEKSKKYIEQSKKTDGLKKESPSTKAIKYSEGLAVLEALKSNQYPEALKIIRNNNGFFGLFRSGRIKNPIMEVENWLVQKLST